jgi:hypothetical protein
MNLSDRELGTIFAALRERQDRIAGQASDYLMLEDIATNACDFEPLTADEIDRLCERLNAAAKPPHVVLYGIPSEGFRAVGPFPGFDAAAAWSQGRPLDSWVVPLEGPDEALGERTE